MDTMALVRAKRVNVGTLITHRFPLERMDEALKTRLLRLRINIKFVKIKKICCIPAVFMLS